MRTDPTVLYEKETPDEKEVRIMGITQKVAIWYILLIQLAIFFKMLI